MKRNYFKLCIILLAISMLVFAVPRHNEVRAATQDIFIPIGYTLVTELFDIETDSETIKGTGQAAANYNFAVNLNQPSGHFGSNILTEGTKVVALYDSIQVPQMYIQNYNSNPQIEGPIQASSSDHANGIAYFDYEDIYNFYMSRAPYGVDFSEVTNLALQSKTTPLTVHKVYVIKEGDYDGGTIPSVVIPNGYNLVKELFNIETDSQTVKGTGQSTSNYQFVVNLNQPSGHFSSNILVEGSKVVALFDSTEVPQMFIQNYNATPEIMGDIQASSSDLENGIAYFDYEDIHSFYMNRAPTGVEFSEITNIVIQSKTSPLTVYRVYIIEKNSAFPGPKILYNYDTNGRLEEIILPTGGKILFQYDQNGNLLKRTLVH